MKDVRGQLERLLAWWGYIVCRRAGVIAVAVVLVTGAVATQLSKIYVDTSTEGFFHEDDPVRMQYDAFRERFGRDTLILLAIEPPEVFDLGFLEKLRSLHRDLEQEVPYLEEVTSLINARETRGEEDRLVVGELMEEFPTSERELAEVRQRALANPVYLDQLISRDGRFTTVLIETEAYSSIGSVEDELAGFDDDGPGELADEPPPFITGEENAEIVEAVLAVADRYRGPDFEIFVAGSPILTDQLQQAMRVDMTRFTSLALLAIVVFLAVLFRRVAGVVLPLVTVVLSVICSLSIAAALGIPLTLPTQILPSFLLAVGVGGSVHILVIFYQARRRGDGKADAIAFALSHSGLAVVMTSLTTAGGLVSFLAAELRPIAQFGIVAPLGALVALGYTLVLLPALIALFPMREETGAAERAPAFSQRMLLRAGDFATHHALGTAAVWGAILVVAFAGALRVPFSHSPWDWFPVDHPLRVANDVMNEKLGGAMFAELLVETGEENGLHDPKLLQSMDELARHAAGIEMGDLYIGKTLSLADVVKETHQALNENRSEFRRVPEDRLLVAQELLLFENSGSDDLENFVDPQFSTGRISMKLPMYDAIRYPPLLAEIRSSTERILGPDVDVQLTGMVVLLTETLSAVTHTMARSYLIALAVITPLMALLIGSVRIGLVAMIPNLAPIVITLGLMGWAGLHLDAFTLLIGSIAIGLAVDDTIHFMHNFRRYYERSGDVVRSVQETLATTGQALLFTSLVLSTGFFLYMFATMQNLFYFGMLTGLTIITAFLADLLLAPALMVLVAQRSELPAELEAEALR